MPFIEGMCGERTYSKGFGPSIRAYSGCAIDRRTVEQRMTCELATPNRPMFSWRWSRERIATFYHQSQPCLPCSIALLCKVRTFFAICSSSFDTDTLTSQCGGIFPHSSAMLNRTRMIGPCQNAAWFFYLPATAPGSIRLQIREGCMGAPPAPRWGWDSCGGSIRKTIKGRVPRFVSNTQ